MNYFKRPIMVEAIQWTGTNSEEIQKFTDGKMKRSKDIIKVNTVSGERSAAVSDYILKNSLGELSVCNSYEFRRDYEKFDDGMDVSVERQFINEPKATVKRTISNKKVKAVIISQDGLTRLLINNKEIKNVSELYFNHDDTKNQPVLSYTAMIENAFED